MKKDHIFVEQRPQGDYAVRVGGFDQASAIAPTQAEAIAKAKTMYRGTAPSVERVRTTATGKPDKWRKA